MAQYAVEILYRDEVTGYVMFIRKTVEVPTEGLAVHVEWLPTNRPGV